MDGFVSSRLRRRGSFLVDIRLRVHMGQPVLHGLILIEERLRIFTFRFFIKSGCVLEFRRGPTIDLLFKVGGLLLLRRIQLFCDRLSVIITNLG